MRHTIGNTGSGPARRILGAAAVVGALTITAHADWTVVNLHPDGATYSQATGVYGGQQVGFATVGRNSYHASLWSGSAASWVDLHPAGAIDSRAYGMYGDQQVGYAEVDGVNRASLWSGTAASWVDLSPAGATISYAGGVYGGQQVGYATIGGVQRASLWTGSAASWVDLSPAGATGSCAVGVYGDQQVGYASVDGVAHASLWSGSAVSWGDLHAVLPPQFTSSFADAIWSNGLFTYVAGYGHNATAGRTEALMWIGPVPEPATGLVLVAGLSALALFRRRK